MKLCFSILLIFTFLQGSFSQEIIPDNQTYGEAETLPKEIRQRIECFTGLNIIISYDEKEGNHNCNAAIFELLTNNERLINVNGLFGSNLNNGENDEILENGEIGLVKEILNPQFPDVGGSRQETFIINSENAQNVFKNGLDEVTLYLECSTPLDGDRGHGYGKCHSNVPTVKISKYLLGQGEKILYHNQPVVVTVHNENGKDRVALITINSCGELIKEGN